MRFIHTADWHLGKRLSGFSLAEQQREALASLLAIVEREGPEAVVVAGDVFDTPVPALSALEAWEWFVGELVGERGVPLVAIPGNHDHPERLGVNARIARRAGLHILNDLADADVPVRIGGAEVFGIPFHKPSHVRAAFGEAVAGLEGDYDAAMRAVIERVRAARTAGAPAVVVAHAFVEGAGSEPEGEDAIVVGGAGTVRAETFAGLDYVALGHLHGAREVGGEGRARYSGSIYPYSFAEAGHEKTVEVVDLDASGVRTRRLPIAVERGVRVIEGRSFEQVMDEAPSVPAAERDDYVLVRVTDTGPIDHALPRLREHYPNALLQQPAIQVDAPAVHFDGDVRTIGVEEAFRSFYRHVYRDDMSELEEAILVEVLSQDDDADAEDAAQEASA